MKRMKVIIPVLAAFLLVWSCSELSKLTKFDIPINDSVDIPVLPAALPNGQEFTKNINTNYQSALSANSVSKDFIDKITLKSFEFKIIIPDNGDFNFLNSIEISISSKELPKKIIAYKTVSSTDVGKVLMLDIDSNADLKEYVLAGEIVMHITLSTAKPTSTPYTLATSAVFNVDAKVLGF